MTKLTLLTILLFSNIGFSKQTYQEAQDLLLSKLSTTQEIIGKESLEWERKFYQSLIEDDDPNIKLLGYVKRLSGFHGLYKRNNLIDISTEINSMIVLQSLSHKSIATIATICSYEQLKPLCNHDAIIERQYQSMPDNAYIFMNNLNFAYEDGNQDEIKQAINDMAQSTYMDAFMYSHEGFRSNLENYVKNNPFPKHKLALEQLNISLFSHPKFNELEEISDNMQDIMIFTMVIDQKISEPIPGYRNLIIICKSNLEHEESCLKIAELFINKSKTIISTQIGYAIKVEILRQLENTTELKQAKIEKLNHKEYYECLSKIMNYGATNMTQKGVEFSRIADPIERAFGDVAFFNSLAQLNYDYYSKLGDNNINNPKNCYEKTLN